MQCKFEKRSDSLDSAVEFSFRDGLAEYDILVSSDRDISGGVKISRALGIDLSCTSLLLIVGNLHENTLTHCCASGWLASTTRLGR
jgi:hypothetical protein